MYLFLFFGLFSTQVSLARVGMATCTKGNCPDGYFCHEQICKKCLRCDLLFRKGNFCVTDFNDCEDCLEGYEEVLVTDFSNMKKPCKQVKKKVKLKLCNDSSCPKNNYCNEESCVKCFDCSLLNRMPPTDKCAKGLNECGSCLIGYYDVSVTTEDIYKPCEKDTLIIPEIPNKIQFGTVATTYIVSSVAIAAAIFLLYKHVKDRVSTKIFNYQPPIYPSAPPLQSVDSPEFVRKTEGVQPPTLAYVEERKQQSKVFKQPSASYYYYYYNNNERTSSSDNDSNDAVVENENQNGPGSCAPPSSAQSEAGSCSPRVIRSRHSELALSELGVDFVQPSETTTEEKESPDVNLVVDVTDSLQPSSENRIDEEIDLSETENEEQSQRD